MFWSRPWRPANAIVQREDSTLNGRDRALREHGIDDPVIALLVTFADKLSTGQLAAPEAVAPVFREAPYLRNMLALADWVGSGREVTATGVLTTWGAGS